MARRGWGRVRRLPSGRVQAAYIDPSGVLRKALTTFETIGDAEAWLADERRLIQRGDWTPPTRHKPATLTTVAEYAAVWLADRRASGRIKPRTAELYHGMLHRHVLPTLGDVALTALEPSTVKRWHSELDTGPTGRANTYSLLRTMLGDAVDDGLIPVNPVRIKGAGSKKRERELRVLTLDEMTRLVDAHPPRYQALVLLAGWCALRFGEVAALTRADIDLKSGAVHVRRALVTVGGVKQLGTPKSSAGRRTVPIPPHILPALRRHLTEHAAFGKDALVFPAADGRDFLALSSLHRVFDRARLTIDRPDLRVHDLRHFGAIMAARTGATVGELQQRLGHSTAQAAMVYQSAVSDRHTQIAARMSELAAAEDL